MSPNIDEGYQMNYAAYEHIETIVPRKPMLSSREVSECSGLTEHSLAIRRMNNQPPDFVRINTRFVRYPRPVIVRWLSERYVNTGAANRKEGNQ
jgi:hypothetical protein